MKIEIDLADKIKLRNIYPVTTEDDRHIAGKLKKEWHSYLKRYKPLVFQPTCEFCRHVGEKTWHCHCPDSPQLNLNVMSFGTCRHWQPNMGLMMFLHMAWFRDKYGSFEDQLKTEAV